MTEPIENKKSRLRRARRIPDLFGLLSLSLLILFLCYAKEGPRYVSEGLALCVKRVIPALFPFMVLSSMILSSRILLPLSNRLSRLFHALFGMGGDSGSALVLGLLCGFPVGASCAVSLYEEGRIDKREFARLMTLANHPSPTFLFLGVGLSLFDDSFFGLLLILVTLLSTLLIGLSEKLLWGSVCPLSPPPSAHGRREKGNAALLFTDAVTSSARALVSISGFVVFFYTLTGILMSAIGNGTLSLPLRALLLGFFEMTGGMAGAALCPAPLSYVLAAVLAGWSGLSVHFQVMSICVHPALSLRPYMIAKIAEGILNGLLMSIGLLLFGYV